MIKVKYFIPHNSSNPSKTYDVSHEEECFFDSLLIKSKKLSGEYQLSRLSNGTINVSYNGYPIGKIKLQGKLKRMMYLQNLYDSKHIEGELKDFINGIDYWLKYINNYIRKDD